MISGESVEAGSTHSEVRSAARALVMLLSSDQAEGAGQADEQTSDPNGLRKYVVVEESADERGEGAGESPAEPVNRHVPAAHVGGRDVCHVFAGGRHDGEFAKGEDDHAEPEAPEACHQRHTAHADAHR